MGSVDPDADTHPDAEGMQWVTPLRDSRSGNPWNYLNNERAVMGFVREVAAKSASLPPPTPLGNRHSMRSIAYCVDQEDEFHVAQCLNVDVSSFGATREEAVANIKEAVELCFEVKTSPLFARVSDVSIGRV